MTNYRKIYERFHGIKIPKGMHIHHIDGNKNNNDISNLQMVTPEEHCRIHCEQGDPWYNGSKWISGASIAARLGGMAGKGISKSEEHTRKNSESNKGIQAGKNHPMFGKHLTNETRKKQSIAKIGKNNPNYNVHRCGKDAPNFGAHFSDEHKKKIQQSMILYWQNKRQQK
jgi:hypothetical protein